MNPERIYRQYRDDALAKQVTASEYTTFVAMPFGDQFSYHSRDILRNVIQKAAMRANEKQRSQRRFAQPLRIDEHAGTALVITEEIIVQILESHLFIADLTFENTGVILETGIALGLKPNSQIVLITQGNLSDLHFDIRNNNVISYKNDDSVDEIAKALIAGANAFEVDKGRYITAIIETLSPDAVICLKHYGKIQQENHINSLHAGVACNVFPNDGRACERFDAGTCALLRARLIRTDWPTRPANEPEFFGMHATDLGWAVIGDKWTELKKPSAVTI
jgi:hypothetical protein